MKNGLVKIKDRKAKNQILVRLTMIKVDGNFGDHRTVGGQVSELRIFIGKGYRVYYTLQGKEIIFLLAGGIKDTQQKDIKTAKQLLKELE